MYILLKEVGPFDLLIRWHVFIWGMCYPELSRQSVVKKDCDSVAKWFTLAESSFNSPEEYWAGILSSGPPDSYKLNQLLVKAHIKLIQYWKSCVESEGLIWSWMKCKSLHYCETDSWPHDPGIVEVVSREVCKESIEEVSQVICFYLILSFFLSFL